MNKEWAICAGRSWKCRINFRNKNSNSSTLSILSFTVSFSRKWRRNKTGSSTKAFHITFSDTSDTVNIRTVMIYTFSSSYTMLGLIWLKKTKNMIKWCSGDPAIFKKGVSKPWRKGVLTICPHTNALIVQKKGGSKTLPGSASVL